MEFVYYEYLETRPWYNRLCQEHNMKAVFDFLSQEAILNRMEEATAKKLPAIQGAMPDLNLFLNKLFPGGLIAKIRQIIGSMVGFIIMKSGYVQSTPKKLPAGCNSIFSTGMVFKKNEESEIIDQYEDIAEILKLVSEYKIIFSEMEQPVFIKIFKSSKYGVYFFEQSHFVHTPDQAGPYITSTNYGPDEKTALRRAMQGFKTFLYIAIKNLKEGEGPDPKWLVKNPNFY